MVWLEGTPTAEELALAELVRSDLEKAQPENPGREMTFGRLTIGDPKLSNLHQTVLRRQGWTIMVRHVERINDGWRAGVLVSLRATNLHRAVLLIKNNHVEVYRCRDGKVSLEREGVAPDWTPTGGLTGASF